MAGGWRGGGGSPPHPAASVRFPRDAAPPSTSPGCSPSYPPLPLSAPVQPLAVGAAASVPAPGARTFLNVLPGRTRPVDFCELPPYQVLPTKLREREGGAREGFGRWRRRWRACGRGERVVEVGAERRRSRRFHSRRAVGSGRRTGAESLGRLSCCAAAARRSPGRGLRAAERGSRCRVPAPGGWGERGSFLRSSPP